MVVHILNNKCLPLPAVYFPNIDETKLYNISPPSLNSEQEKLGSLISEYFADIFAVRFIGRHKIHLANYIILEEIMILIVDILPPQHGHAL